VLTFGGGPAMLRRGAVADHIAARPSSAASATGPPGPALQRVTAPATGRDGDRRAIAASMSSTARLATNQCRR